MTPCSSQEERVIIAQAVYSSLKVAWWCCAAIAFVAFISSTLVRRRSLHKVADETWGLAERIKNGEKLAEA